MEMTTSNLGLTTRIYIYIIDVFNSKNNPFVSVLKIYRFKLFKKTTKFKRYNRGLTRFITNRKKYILRKKRTSLQFMTNLTYFWTQSYQDLRNFVRFSQSLNVLEHSLTLTNKLFTKKTIYKLIESQTVQNSIPPLNLVTIKKVILMNSSLYNSNIGPGFISIFKNTQVGIVNFPLSDKHLRDTLHFGVLTDFKNSYASDVSSMSPVKLGLVLSFLFKQMFNINLNIVKISKKILTLLILMFF